LEEAVSRDIESFRESGVWSGLDRERRDSRNCAGRRGSERVGNWRGWREDRSGRRRCSRVGRFWERRWGDEMVDARDPDATSLSPCLAVRSIDEKMVVVREGKEEDARRRRGPP